MTIPPDELRRLSIVSKSSLTIAGLVWAAAFALCFVLEGLAALPQIFALSLVVCGLAFAYVAAACLVTWHYDSARKRSGPSFDSWNPLKRFVIREQIKP